MSGKPSMRVGRGRLLYEEFRARIADGTFVPGSRLPSSRACAAERGLSRTTVTAVFEQLAAEGYIDSRPGAASRVAHGLTQPSAKAAASVAPPPLRLSEAGKRLIDLAIPFVPPAPTGSFDFAYGPLAGEDFPTATWAKAMRRADLRRPSRLAYEDPRGSALLREELQRYLARARGLHCEVGQLAVTNGSQQALDLCARLLLNPGDRVVVENPGYRMAHRAFAATGARLCPVGVDEQGLITRELPASARLAYVTPSHQFPLGGFLSAPRRVELLEWASRCNACLIEDDYDGEYRHAIRPEPTLKSLDGEDRVIYVGTLSKTLSPELRVGYAVLPAALVEPFVQLKQVADRHSPTAHQRALAELLADGSYERHVRRMRRVQLARQQALLAAFERHLGDRVTIQGAATGLHVLAWVKGLPRSREAELISAARERGVFVYPLSQHLVPTLNAGRSGPVGLVVGYALLRPNQIDVGVQRLAKAIRVVVER
jgi:GntR family transcriptional regulator/MocR family aminotransferase